MIAKNLKFTNPEETIVLATLGDKQSWIPVTPGLGQYSLVEAVLEAGEVIAPYEEPSKPKRRKGSPREFLDLFTEEEEAAFFEAEASNVTFRVWWAKASTGEFSLDHPTVKQGLSGLVAAEILTQDRADEIFASDFNAT